MVQFVSPQVWASRPGRATAMARDFDLVLSIFPFEKDWYAKHAPALRVEFVGHPMVDRYGKAASGKRESGKTDMPSVLLLPGSRVRELKHHLPVMIQAVQRIHACQPARWRMVVPSEKLAQTVRLALPAEPPMEVEVGRLAEALAQADLALAKSGTVTLECAFFGVPAVVLYKVSPAEFLVARRIVRVDHIAMPNLLAGEAIFPEFLQNAATPEALAGAAFELLGDDARRQHVKAKLQQVVTSLGPPGAARRAAQQIVGLLAAPPLRLMCSIPRAHQIPCRP
jgi:lipid-A-disaccharide synthase